MRIFPPLRCQAGHRPSSLQAGHALGLGLAATVTGFLLAAGLVWVAMTGRHASARRAGMADPGRPVGTAPAGAAPTARTVEPPARSPGTQLDGILQVSDVHAAAEGWAVLDGRAGRVVTVDPRGGVQGPFGGPGEGPGELSGPARVARRGFQVAVLDVAATRLDRFGPRGQVLPRLRLPAGTCLGTMAEDLDVFAGAWIVLRRCTRRDEVTAQVLAVEDDGTIRTLARDPLARETVDPFLRPLLLTTPEGLFLGSTRAPCLRKVAGEVGPASLCVAAVDGPRVPDALRERLEGALAGRARTVGIDLRVPERLPALLEVRRVGEGAVAVRRPRDERSAPWVLEGPGEAAVTLQGRAGARVEPGPNGFLVMRESLDGMRVWVVPGSGGP